MAAIEAENLTRVYRVGDEEVRALDGLSLSVPEGELAAVVGPSGSGKSTLLALLGGLDTATTGRVSVHGEALETKSADELAAYRRDSVGFIFQDFFLLGHLTAEENVEVPLKLAGVERTERRARARELIELVGLAHRGGHLPNQLSGGERQRVAIARALSNRPKLVLADEPTGNLDEKIGQEIIEILVKLNADQKMTMVMVTHNPLVADRTRRQFRLGSGKLIEETVKP
jgi:putative ABC transport system ATP-binding protein